VPQNGSPETALLSLKLSFSPEIRFMPIETDNKQVVLVDERLYVSFRSQGTDFEA